MTSVSLILTASLITACSNTNEVVVAKADPAIQQLLLDIQEISEYERKLYELESSRHAKTNDAEAKTLLNGLIPSLGQYENMGDSYSGTLENILELITDKAGLEPVRYIGVKPSHPIIVHVDTSDTKLIDMVRNAGYQAGNRAAVGLKVRERLIEVEYKR